MEAEAGQLTDSEVRPILAKDRVLWQLQSRMIAVLQTLPTRSRVIKDQLVIAPLPIKKRWETKDTKLRPKG
eukprot:1340774-Karenia_brevis.AAC.1